MSAEEKAFQSSLLRLVILCSTGLASLVPSSSTPSEVHLTFPASPSNGVPSPTHFASLRTQIRHDAIQLFTEAGKRATSLSLALKPSKSRIHESTPASSPIEGLDAPSIIAAQKQIDDYTSDLIPKLIFLASKSWKEAQVYIEEAPKEGVGELSKGELEDRHKMEELARQMGGTVMTGAELHGASKSYTRRANLGLGLTWAKSFKLHVGEVLQAVASLAEACMNERTRGAVTAASQARERRDGRPVPPVHATGAGKTASKATIESLRRDCLGKTAAVLEACDEAVKHFPSTNVEAVRTKFVERGELIEDGMQELASAASSSEIPTGPEDVEDNSDTLDLEFSAEKIALAQRLIPLLKMGRLAHERVLETSLTSANAEGDSVDLSILDDVSELLAKVQDDLVAAVIWDDFDQGEEEGGEDDQDTGSVSLGIKARLICQSYCEAIQNLSDQVSDDDKLKIVAEEMKKLSNGITDAEWKAALDEDGE